MLERGNISAGLYYVMIIISVSEPDPDLGVFCNRIRIQGLKKDLKC